MFVSCYTQSNCQYQRKGGRHVLHITNFCVLSSTSPQQQQPRQTDIARFDPGETRLHYPGTAKKFLAGSDTPLGVAERLLKAGEFGDGTPFPGAPAPDPPIHKGVLVQNAEASNITMYFFRHFLQHIGDLMRDIMSPCRGAVPYRIVRTCGVVP